MSQKELSDAVTSQANKVVFLSILLNFCMIFSSRNDNHIIALLCTTIHAVGLECKNNGVEKRSEPKQIDTCSSLEPLY